MLCSIRDAVWNSGWLLSLGSPRRLLWVVCEPQILCCYRWFPLLFGCLQLALLDVKSADFTESSYLSAFSLYLQLNIYFLTFACSILNKLTYSKTYHRAFSESYRVCLWLLRLSVSIGNATGCVLLGGLHIKMSTFWVFCKPCKVFTKMLAFGSLSTFPETLQRPSEPLSLRFKVSCLLSLSTKRKGSGSGREIWAQALTHRPASLNVQLQVSS